MTNQMYLWIFNSWVQHFLGYLPVLFAFSFISVHVFFGCVYFYLFIYFLEIISLVSRFIYPMHLVLFIYVSLLGVASHDKVSSPRDDSKAKADWHVVTPDVRGYGPKSPGAISRSQLPTGMSKTQYIHPVCQVCSPSVLFAYTPTQLEKSPERKMVFNCQAKVELKLQSGARVMFVFSNWCLSCSSSCNIAVAADCGPCNDISIYFVVLCY